MSLATPARLATCSDQLSRTLLAGDTLNGKRGQTSREKTLEIIFKQNLD